VTEMKEHIYSVTAVLVLANGTISRNAGGLFSILSAIAPQTLATNIAFIFTNVSDHLYMNSSPDAVPGFLKDAPQFLLNNPLAVQRKYLELKDRPNMKRGRAGLRKMVKADEQNAMAMLVDLFDWLAGLEPQTIADFSSLCETRSPTLTLSK
jgi:hypothetical protein